MNGTDIRGLAERASALEDRTGERLGQVHARVARARRQRRVTAIAGAAALVVIAAVSMAAVTASRDDSTPQPAPLPEVRAVPTPERGTCWAVPPGSVGDPEYWYDDSPQVPCTQEHTTETVTTFELAEPTPEAAEEYADRCYGAVESYLGVDWASWIPNGVFFVLPSKEQIADGASWMRCDAAFPSNWNGDAVRTVSVPAAGIADNPPDDSWACLNEPPAVAEQPFVPCDQPHLYESTGTAAMISGAETYPTKADRDRELPTQCARGVPESRAGTAVTGVWSPPEQFEPYANVFAICWMSDPGGQPLPAR